MNLTDEELKDLIIGTFEDATENINCEGCPLCSGNHTPFIDLDWDTYVEERINELKEQNGEIENDS